MLRRGSSARALSEVELILKDAKAAEADEARVSKIELLLRLRDVAGARHALEAMPAPSSEHRARIDRAKAYVALDGGGEPKEALEAAEAAATADPKSNEALLLLCRALVM